jgi:hypothetical protein
MKKSSVTIGNRSRDLPVCSAMPQPLRHRVPHGKTIELKCGSLNLLEPSGPVQACNGIALPTHVYVGTIIVYI